MNVIVTGASGFIGKNLMLAMPKTWDVAALYHTSSDFLSFLKRYRLKNIRPRHCDLTGNHGFSSIAGQRPYDVCVYLSANGDPAFSAKDPLTDLKKNTVALVNFLTRIKVKKFIFFSSGAVYDGLTGKVSPQSRVHPHLPYAISKLSSELYIESMAKKGNISKYAILRFFGAYGPFEPPRKIYTKLAKAFYLDKGNEFTITGDGRNFIDAMAVEDTIKGIMKVIVSSKANCTVDFCSGTPVSINELVKTAANVFNVSPVKIRHQGDVPEYIRFQASPKRMETLFGFKPKVRLEEGLLKLAHFLKKEAK